MASLDTLQLSFSRIEQRLGALETEIVKLNAKETPAMQRVKSLEEWRAKLTDISSPPQLKEHIEEIEKLKIFKTRATFIFSVIQGAVLIIAVLSRFIPAIK